MQTSDVNISNHSQTKKFPRMRWWDKTDQYENSSCTLVSLLNVFQGTQWKKQQIHSSDWSFAVAYWQALSLVQFLRAYPTILTSVVTIEVTKDNLGDRIIYQVPLKLSLVQIFHKVTICITT